MADQTPQTAAAPDAAATLSVQTAALAKEIAAEAAADGGWDDSPGTEAPARETRESVDAARSAPAATDDEDDDGDETPPGDEESEAAAAAASAAGLSPEIVAMVKARDIDGLSAALGIENPQEYFKIKAEDFKSIRHEKRKLDKSISQLSSLETQLREKYSDPVTARKAFQAGDLNAYFQTLERWSGVPHAEVQKAWALHVQGKPVPKLEPKTEALATVTPTADQSKITKLKERIATEIKTHALSAKAGIVDLVFDKMRAEWNNGVRTPAAALKLVAADIKNASASDRALLRKAGVLPKKGKKQTVTTPRVPSRSSATSAASTGARGTTQKMTDKELAQDVMRGLGKDAWRS